MASGLILETSFLIDLEREARRRAEGPANRFLADNASERFYTTPIVAGELAVGHGAEGRDRWAEALAPFHVLQHTDEVAWRYGEAFRYLTRNGIQIGSNDLWIAAAAIAYGMAVVTGNERHFRRVPGLQVTSHVTPAVG